MNKRIVLSTLALFAFGILFLGTGNSYSQEFPQPKAGWDTLEASLMLEGQVTTESGEYLAGIRDLVIDPENGQISEVVLSGIQDRGGERVSIPPIALTHSGTNLFVFDKSVEYRWRFSRNAPYYFEEPYMQWAELQFIYSVPPDPEGAYRFSTLMGAPVRTPKGDEVGRVNDLVVDLAKNRLVYVVLSDVGEGKMVAVPFKELSKESGDTFVLHVTKEKLVDAPAFTWSDVSNREFAASMFRYYGLRPYWGEEE